MPYTLYRNVTLRSVQQEKISPRMRPQEIADPAKRRSDYYVSTATFSGVSHSVAISDFRKLMHIGQLYSIAVDDKEQVIAVVNLTTGEKGMITPSASWKDDIGGTLFFLAIPSILCYFIAQKAFSTTKYHDAGWYILGVGVLIIVLVLRGILKQYSESKRALAELS